MRVLRKDIRSNSDCPCVDTEVYVSPGVGGWYIPIRTEGHCTYEVITLLPAE